MTRGGRSPNALLLSDQKSHEVDAQAAGQRDRCRTLGVRRRNASAWLLRRRCSRARSGGRGRMRSAVARSPRGAERWSTPTRRPSGNSAGASWWWRARAVRGGTPTGERPPCTNPVCESVEVGISRVDRQEARPVSWCWRSRRGREIGLFGSCTKPHNSYSRFLDELPIRGGGVRRTQ